MADSQVSAKEERKDFFISYTGKDSQWAQWIAFELEAAGYHTIIQAWDIRPGSNFVAEMDEAATRALRTIAVLSQAYLGSDYAFAEWAAAFRRDPKGKQSKVLPVRIERCTVEGLLGPIGYIDLVDLDEQRASEKLLAGVKRERAKPTMVPFPTSTSPSGPLVNRPVFPGSLPSIWNIPYPQNPLFTGRKELLTQLATTLHAGQPTALSQPQAISGLGGIGKTQLALEYAYRYRGDYQAVLWAQADTHENLTSSYLTIAALLNLPEKSEQESARVIAAMKNWLQRNTGWLLILDNADDLALARDFLPPSSGGHVLLTTRAQATGRFVRRLEVDTLSTELGALFLLRRAGLISPDASLEVASSPDVALAKEITQELGGLPLALDQAGAYIEEIPCSLSEYQRLYRTQRAEMLRERGGLVDDHPESVTTTWSLSFQNIEQQNPAAADLLRLCAFLAADAIPEEMITAGAEHLGLHLQSIADNPLAFHKAIAALSAYSLLRRNVTSKTLSLHRLVQAVLKDAMSAETQRDWTLRAIRAVNAAFPNMEFETWPQCDRLLPHALVCAEMVKQESLTSLEAASLLYGIGAYLIERARSQEAQPLLQQALALTEQHLGTEHTEIANIIDRLARCFENQGKYSQAEPLYQHVLAIREQQLGPEHPDTARSLNNLAALYQAQGKYSEAEPLYQRALTIDKKALGSEHPDLATDLNSLANLYRAQGKYEQAEPLLKRALTISEQQVGAQHPNTATSLNNLALLYHHQGKYEQAEPLYQRALAIREQQLGPQHPSTANSLNNLAELYRAQGKYEQAEPLYQRALAISEQQLGAQHPDTASSLNNLAALYHDQGKYEQAEPLLVQALSIREQQLGPDHPHTATSLNNLALLYQAQGKYEQAEPLYQRALSIDEKALGPEHPDLATDLNNLALLYRAHGEYEQAEPLYQRALSIWEQQLGPDHPNTATSLNNLAGLYQNQGKYEQAEPLLQRALSIWEQQLGPDHPNTATSIWWLAVLSEQQQQYEQAASLYQRALAIYESALGPQHPTTQRIRANYAHLLRTMGHDAEAATLDQP